jgi:hypothetical protein
MSTLMPVFMPKNSQAVKQSIPRLFHYVISIPSTKELLGQAVELFGGRREECIIRVVQKESELKASQKHSFL